MSRLLEALTPSPTMYSEVDIPKIESSALFTTRVYFTILVPIRRLGSLFSNYSIITTLLQISIQTLSTLLKINPCGIHVLVYNSLTVLARPYSDVCNCVKLLLPLKWKEMVHVNSCGVPES